MLYSCINLSCCERKITAFKNTINTPSFLMLLLNFVLYHQKLKNKNKKTGGLLFERRCLEKRRTKPIFFSLRGGCNSSSRSSTSGASGRAGGVGLGRGARRYGDGRSKWPPRAGLLVLRRRVARGLSWPGGRGCRYSGFVRRPAVPVP